MPPKKKQEQIDISTLPQCHSANVIIHVRGKKERSLAVQSYVYQNLKNIMSKITRPDIMDFAKEKSIYVDPNTLNQKQKKDPKFMQSICTQLTPQVFAKAFKAFIQNKNIKVRMDKKLSLQKSQSQLEKYKKIIDSKYDWFYLTNEVLETKEQYEALAENGNNIKFVLTIIPKLNWANSPYPQGQIPQNIQEEQDNDQNEENDQELKQFKLLKQKQIFTQEDIHHQKQVVASINKIKEFRTSSKRQSNFRDTFIDQIQCFFDPYNQKQFNNEVMRLLVQRIQKLSAQYHEFLEWKKDKTSQSIQINQKLQQQQTKDLNNLKIEAKGQNHLEILLNLVDDMYSNKAKYSQKQEDIQFQIESLINGYDFSGDNSNAHRTQSYDINVDLDVDQQITTKIRKGTGASLFLCQNQIEYSGFGINQSFTKEQNEKVNESIRRNLQFPGIDRCMMPQIPQQSKHFRKFNQSFYTKFIPKNMNFDELQRRLSLKKFQQILKDLDQDRDFATNINQRVYQQFHNEKSLMRQLYRAMSLNQGHFVTKYNPQNDKLYVVMHYKTNQRRAHKKIWESNWKVVPNYQNWIKYFKENQANMNNQEFYDIDYEKIGNINQKVQAFCVPDGGVIIKKYATIANFQNKFLYAIKNHHIFGVNQHSNTFYSQNLNTRIYHYETASQQNLQTLLILDNGLEIRLKHTGDILIQNKTDKKDKRLYTADGYTIIFDKATNDYKILHPTGGVSSAKSYINQLGYGLNGDILQHIPTLLRRSEQYQIVKRDDNTIIINQSVLQSQHTKKWIKFQDGTQYYLQNELIKIQKEGIPFVQIDRTKGQIKLLINQLQIKGSVKIIGQNQQNDQKLYGFQINYKDGNHIKTCGSTITVTEQLYQIPYVIDLYKKTFVVQFQDEKIQMSFSKDIGMDVQVQSSQCKYYKNNKIYDAEDEEIQQAEIQESYKDYLQPKLFIISPNNTGVQLLTEKQLEFYFHNKQKSIQQNKNINTISKITENYQDCGSQVQKVYIVSKLVQPCVCQKRINPSHKINLDIYYPKKIRKVQKNLTTYTVRTLIKYMPLQNLDNQKLLQIITKKSQLFKQLQKEENQYGYKTKEVLQEVKQKQKQKDKIIMIEFRKKESSLRNFQQLKEEAIKQLGHQQKMHMTLIEQQEKQTIIRNRMMERKKSVIEQYPYLSLKDKQEFQEANLDTTLIGCFNHYFQTLSGKKALAEMPQWVFRPKTAKQRKQLDPQIVSEMNNTMNRTKKQSQNQIKQERYDTVDVNLNPIRQIIIKPSVFTQRQIDQERGAFQQQKKAYKYHERKRKDFNIYGSDRQEKIEVSSLLRTQPISQINQKYLITEAPVDKKIKISSMKNKLTSQASSVAEMRKQGPHNTLLKTIDKRNDYNTLLQKRTMMVHADLNDKLQRDILINPIQANFGYLKEGKLYELKINIKNQDIIAQRLVVKKPRTVYARVNMNQMGPIALGMNRKVTVQLKTSILGKFQDEFEIVSKHEIYRIPISANILSQTQFDNQSTELDKNVRQIVQISGRKGGRSGIDLPPLN